jgi:lipopolysaccharide export system permease protein
MMQFERYGVLVSRQSQSVVGDRSARSQPMSVLLVDRSSSNMGELLWRVSLPLMSLFLMLLAIPLSFVNPRGGRSANLLIALLLFVVYSNTVSVFQATVVQQRLPLSVAWWPIHLLALLAVIFMFSWRLKVNSRYHPAAVWAGVKRGLRAKKAGAQ